MILQSNLTNMAQATTDQALKLAEAANDLGALKVIFGIFVAFMVIIIFLFVYQFIATNKKISHVYDSISKVDQYFDSANAKTIGNGQAQVLIRRSFNNIATIMKYHILKIRMENNISDKDRTVKKIDMMVQNEYNELASFLSNFICDGAPISDLIREDDITSIKNIILEQVYIPKDSFSASQMDQTVSMYIQGLKLIYLKNF